MRRGFASDNYAGVHPEVMAAIAAANGEHQIAYGEDDVTKALDDRVRDIFGARASIFPVFNGTGANVVGLKALSRSWEAAICTATAHVHVDEGGAPEKVGGVKLWPVTTPDGKLTPDLVDTQAWGFGDVHRAQPRVLAITQSTELGTLYQLDELRELIAHARKRELRVLVDGARIANAAASLGVGLREATTDVGIDVLSFGGTKNGAMGAEAVIVFDPELADAVDYLRKSTMQLASKMRFISAQLLALLTDDLWLRNASHANTMARRLADGAGQVDGVEITQVVEANAVFATLPPAVAERLQDRFRFYTWDQATGEVRWMCSWDTTESDVDEFVAALTEEMGAGEAHAEEPGRG